LEKRQEVLMEAIDWILYYCQPGREKVGDCPPGTAGGSHQRKLRKLFGKWEEPPPEEEPGEDQEWKTCDCCGGKGKVDEVDEGGYHEYVDCDACDGKGKYIDDME
jgi:hypothetical protein